MTSRDSKSLRQGQIDDSGLTNFHTPRYNNHSPERSPDRLRRDMTARRPVRMARADKESDKRLQAKLESRRQQQQQQNEEEDVEGEKSTEPVARVTVVTFPHYEVDETADSTSLPIDNSLLLQEIEDTLGLSRTQSFRTSARNKRYDVESETELLRRHVDARRSYNTKKKLAIAILPNKPSVLKSGSADNLDQYEGDTMARPPSTNGLDKSRGPGIIGPILDIEPVDTKMTGLMGERRKTTLSNNNRFNNHRDPKEPSSNPGISNSTHMLLQSKMNTQFFSFPEISADQQRKAGCTPRSDGPPKPRRANSRSPPRASRHRPKHNTAHEYKRLDYQSDSELSEPSPKNNVSRHSARSIEPANMCPDSTRKNRDRYSRMIALGLPKVNIDIDRNHFSRQSLKRRSLQLRERYDMFLDQDEESFNHYHHHHPQATSITTTSTTAAAIGINTGVVDDIAVESIEPTNEETSTVNWNAGGSGITIPGAQDEGDAVNREGNSIINGSVVSDGTQLKRLQPKSGGKETVGVSYFKMGQPGKYENQFTLMDPPNSPRYKQVYQGNSGQQQQQPPV